MRLPRVCTSIADIRDEIPVAIRLTPVSQAGPSELRAMLRKTFAESPDVAFQGFAADHNILKYRCPAAAASPAGVAVVAGRFRE
jgi:hypothetical protein